MSIRSQIDRINENVANTYSVLAEVGADMPQDMNTNNLSETVSSIKVVLYGKEQSLTDAQKNQARQNIGAQPAGDYVLRSELPAPAKISTVNLLASQWIGDTNPWSQVVTVNSVTENSKIDLQPTAIQIVELQNNGITLMIQNDNGTVTAWAIGNKPTNDYTMQAFIQEVLSV